MNFLFTALGGALGAAGRYALSLVPVRIHFPLMTFLTNLLGALLIGLIARLVGSRENVSQNAVLFWKTGVCGGFTTFSTFSLETVELFEKGDYGTGIFYAVISVLCCAAGVLCGKKLALLLS